MLLYNISGHCRETYSGFFLYQKPGDSRVAQKRLTGEQVTNEN